MAVAHEILIAAYPCLSTGEFYEIPDPKRSAT